MSSALITEGMFVGAVVTVVGEPTDLLYEVEGLIAGSICRWRVRKTDVDLIPLS